MPWRIARHKFYKLFDSEQEEEMPDNPIHKAPELSVYEKSLLHDNKRLRDELAAIAAFLNPKWRDEGLALRSDWMLQEIQKMDTNINKLLDIAEKGK